MIVTPRQPVKAPEPGVYNGVPAIEYHRWAGVSQTLLKMVGRWEQEGESIFAAPEATPAHVHAYLQRDMDDKDTDSLVLGERMHCLLLEPDRFVRQYRALPEDLDRRTKAGKDEYAALCNTYGERNLVPSKDWALMQAMTLGAARNSKAKPLLGAPGSCEVSYTWIDEQTGLACKCRLDKIVTQTARIIVDLKTTRCAHWKWFQRDVVEYGYDQQAAHYVDGERIVSGADSDALYLIVAIEKTAPHLTVVYRVPPEVIEAGRVKNRAAMNQLAQCVSTNEWPGYADERVIDLVLPEYGMAEVTAA